LPAFLLSSSFVVHLFELHLGKSLRSLAQRLGLRCGPGCSLQVLATDARHKAFSSGLSTAIPLAGGNLTWFFLAGIKNQRKELAFLCYSVNTLRCF
jgi:hypothetical protein